MDAYSCDRVIVLDQGSRPGPSIVSATSEAEKTVLIVDHHMSTEVRWHLEKSDDTVARRIDGFIRVQLIPHLDDVFADLPDVSSITPPSVREDRLGGRDGCRRRWAACQIHADKQTLGLEPPNGASRHGLAIWQLR